MRISHFCRLVAGFVSAACGLSVFVTAVPAIAQEAAGVPAGMPQDWSHRHVIHSNPDTLEEAAAKGKLDQWIKRADDPRFVLQLEKKLAKLQSAADAEDDEPAAAGRGARKSALAATPGSGKNNEKPAPSGKKAVTPSGAGPHRDWSNVMGGASGAGRAGTFPAKFGFGAGSSSCTNDFVVFTTSTAGAQGTGTFYSLPGTFSAVPTAGQTFSLTNNLYTPVKTLTLTADASVNTGLSFAVGATATEAATNLANAIRRNGGTVGLTATSAGAVVTVTSITAGIVAGNITPAETSAVFAWGAEVAGTGTKGQPTIFALNQLYASTAAGGCQTSTQAVPATYWAYNTGTGSVADLSPVLSLNGDQVAFIQRTSGNVAQLVLLKWASGGAGTLGAPTDLTASVADGAAYRACTPGPCQLTLPLNGAPNNTTSSPFVDYANDVLYVGDAAGKLHKFTGVFSGTPVEVVSTGTNVWPATISSTALTSPVYDFGTGNVFVGSARPASAAGTGALHAVHSTIGSGTGGITSTGQLLVNNFTARFDSPIVDSSTGKVYVFVGEDANNAGRGAVYQFSTGPALDTQGTGNKATTVSGVSSTTMWSGTFDEAYYSGSGNTGYMYVCGGTAANANPVPFRISMTGTFGSSASGTLQDLGGGNVQCSPVTSTFLGGSDYIFMGVNNGNDPACNNNAGCVYMFRLRNAFNTTSTSATINDNTARFLSVSTSTAPNVTEASVATALTAAQAGTYVAMAITQSLPSPAGTTFTYTLRKNGATPAKAPSCTIAAGSSTCTHVNLGNVQTYAAGDTMDVMVQRTAGTGSLTATFGVNVDPWIGSTATAGLVAAGGTGGIIIDNHQAGGGSQIYYSTLTSPGNAVQASQVGLQ